MHGIDEIWVATDSLIAENIISIRYGSAIKIFRRSKSSSTDKAPMINVVKEFIAMQHLCDEISILLVQATVPFTSITDIQKAISEIKLNPFFDSLLSCRLSKKFCWSSDGQPINYNLSSKPRRQDYAGLIVETGAFYASTVHNILKTGNLLSGNIKIIMSGAGTALDIDTEHDWQLAEAYINYGLYT
jgi:N-acylneuraminate cytidylyltransferase